MANIDEDLTGYPYYKSNVPGVAFVAASKHTWALNEVQRFFIEDTRLGVPAEFTDEGIRGVEHFKATDFPTQLGLGQTWDRTLIHKIGEVEGREAHALGYVNVYAPIMDVMRDPRWGRCLESYGEDPFLVSELAIQMVNGMQSQQIVSTMKHFCIYADNEGAREGYARNNPRCPPREAEMLHLWPYERVIREANPLGVMCSYNDYDGVPIESSHYYLTDVLRTRFGFKGYVVSDSGAVEYLAKKHHTATDMKDAVRQSVLAGLNVRTTFTPPETYVTPLRELVREGAVPMSVLDDRVRDVLRVKFWEGLFDEPYRPLTNADATVLSPKMLRWLCEPPANAWCSLKIKKISCRSTQQKSKPSPICGPNADNPDYAKDHYGPINAPMLLPLRQALEEALRWQGRILFTRKVPIF